MAMPSPQPEATPIPNLLESDKPVQDALNEIFSFTDTTKESHPRVNYFQQDDGPLECLVDITYYGDEERGIPADYNHRFIHMKFDSPDIETGEYSQVTITDTERANDPRKSFMEHGMPSATKVNSVNASIFELSRDGHILTGQTRTSAWGLNAVATYPTKHPNSGTEGLLEIATSATDRFGDSKYPYEQHRRNRRQPTYFAPGEEGFNTGMDAFAAKLIGIGYHITDRLIED